MSDISWLVGKLLWRCQLFGGLGDGGSPVLSFPIIESLIEGGKGQSYFHRGMACVSKLHCSRMDRPGGLSCDAKEMRNDGPLHVHACGRCIVFPDAHVPDFDPSCCIILFFRLPHGALATLPRLHDQVFGPFQAPSSSLVWLVGKIMLVVCHKSQKERMRRTIRPTSPL
jgi:hypothetical protein